MGITHKARKIQEERKARELQKAIELDQQRIKTDQLPDGQTALVLMSQSTTPVTNGETNVIITNQQPHVTLASVDLDEEELLEEDEIEQATEEEAAEEDEVAYDEELTALQRAFAIASENTVRRHSFGVKLLITLSMTTPYTHADSKEVFESVDGEHGPVSFYNPFRRQKEGESEPNGFLRQGLKEVLSIASTFGQDEVTILSHEEEHLAIAIGAADSIAKVLNEAIEQAAGISGLEGIPVVVQAESAEDEENEEHAIPFDSLYQVKSWVSKPLDMDSMHRHTDLIQHIGLNVPYLYDTKALFKRVEQISTLLTNLITKEEASVETYFGVILSAGNLANPTIRTFISEALQDEEDNTYSLTGINDLELLSDPEAEFSGNDHIDDIVPVNDAHQTVELMFPFGGDMLLLRKLG